MRLIGFMTLLFVHVVLAAQTDHIVNFGTSTHPFEIHAIKHTDEETVVELSIVNQLAGGYFCADTNIYISNQSKAYQAHLVRSEGIPTCPDVYSFKRVGEKLRFRLFFDRVPSDIPVFDLVEACDENCFRIGGIINDEEMNRAVNESYDFFAQNKLEEAVASAKKVVETYPDYPYGFLLFNLIHFNAIKGDYETAKTYLRILKKAPLHDKRNIIGRLQAMEYYVKIM